MRNENEILKLRIKELEKTNLILQDDLIKAKSHLKTPRSNFLEDILNNIPSDLVVFDLDHNYIFVNELAIRDSEVRAWILGKNDYDYCYRKGWPSEIADNRRALFLKVFEGKKELTFEERLINREGKEIWNLRRLYPVFDHNKEVKYVFGYATDITYLKETEAKLEIERFKSEKSLRSKELFLANMSHEIRTPMNAILGLTKLLETAKLTIKEKSFLQGIKKSSSSLLVIINDILDFSKINDGMLKVEKTEVYLYEVLEQLRLLYETKCIEKDIFFETKIDDCLTKCNVFTDPVRLEQILNNLLSNAIKFTQKGTVLLRVKCISTNNNRKEIAIEVSDTGIGIPPEKQSTIFKPFEQADLSTTREFGGTGLGLAISNKLVDLLGGELRVESEENKGSTFSFIINTKYSKREVSIIKEKELSIKKFDLTILLVEDNVLNQLYAESLLIDLGCTVKVASNGVEAIDLLTKTKYDLILMDIQMPVMGGEECLTKIRDQLNINIPVIACTANAFKKDIENYLLKGFNEALPKPFTVDELVSILKKY